jgi:hypothetical protein
MRYCRGIPWCNRQTGIETHHHYESDKLVNIGTNRWAVKPELGVSKTWGPLTLELMASVTFYTDNNDLLAVRPGSRIHCIPCRGISA